MTGPLTPRTLDDWLAWQQQLNSAGIDLGLDRVRRVGESLDVLRPEVPVVNVAGTNGKGSVVACLEAMLTAAGYRPGAYTSPHILRYSERIRVAGRELDEEALIAAFETVEAARGDVPLTYFEFGTLAALVAFERAGTDILVLEVGLGGRLDAVNAVDPDVAVITSIGLDHSDWLGDTLEAVAGEKAGIMRGGVPAVFGSAQMPEALFDAAARLGAPVYQQGRDYGHQDSGERWSVQLPGGELDDLPVPVLAGAHQRDNAATAVAALRLLAPRIPVPSAAVSAGLEMVSLPGRCQRVKGSVEWVLDVAHNADAARALAACLRELPAPAGRTWALFGAMARKDRDALVAPLAGLFDGWFLMTLPQEGAWPAAALAASVRGARADAGAVRYAGPAEEALAALDAVLRPGDRVVAFGSFHTVERLLSDPECRVAC